MARKENLEFLVSVCPASLSNKSYDDLLTWLFGDEERSLAVCSRVAFKSMKRKIRGTNKMPIHDEPAYKAEVNGLITRCVDVLLKRELSSREAFYSWHKESCEKICELSDKHIEGEFSYGFAQYLLNLTLKNMLLMESWDEYFEPIKNSLHIPADGKIIEAASEKLGIKIIDTQGQYSLYEVSKTKPWRRWNYSDYIRFQEDVRNSVDCPMDWELSVWTKTTHKEDY